MRTAILALLLITACTTTTTPTILDEEQAITACIQECEETLATGTVLDSECLGTLDDNWVCDVAHTPRQDQDNLVDNQCTAYRLGTHIHFVEVTPECELIRAR